MFLGPDLIPFLLLALGAALVVGNGLAMIKPRLEPRTENELRRAPVVLAQRAVGAEDRLEARHVRLEHLAHLVEVKGG